MLHLVFNELSAPHQAPVARDPNEARHLLENWADLLLDASVCHPKVLVVPDGFLQLQVAAGYTVGRWRGEIGGDRDRRLRVKGFLERRITLGELRESENLPQADGDYRCNGVACDGLGLALEVAGLCLSLASASQWDVSLVPVEKSAIAAEDVFTTTLNVHHAATLEHLVQLRAWLESLRLTLPLDGAALWRDRAALFPSLDFCDGVEPPVVDLAGTSREFKAVAGGLNDLQQYSERWDTPYFDIHKLVRASPESQQTLNNFAAERTFLCPDNIPRIFNWHLKRGDAWRIHFIDYPQTKRFLVGYAGRHLRTWTG